MKKILIAASAASLMALAAACTPQTPAENTADAMEASNEMMADNYDMMADNAMTDNSAMMLDNMSDQAEMNADNAAEMK